ncbi:MAG: VacJ family lipoprotein [Thiohalomonadaceae bacterium]
MIRNMLLMPRLSLLCLLLVITGCATVPGEPDPRDPWEGFNRGVHEFNADFDKKILKPVAERYVKTIPRPARTGITNFFSNLGDIVVLTNDLLQFKSRQAASDFARLLWNSTAGLAGFIDVATPMGLPKHREDFGQTFGYWGIGPGPYLVIPFLGPSSLRDGTGLAVGYFQFNPVHNINDNMTRNAVFGLSIVDMRAGLLYTTRMLEQGALDPYLFMRDSYMQMRENLVYDGNPPIAEFDFDELDDFD